MLVEEITVEECSRALAEASFGRLACARDNQPYIVPIHFAVDGNLIYSFAMPGQKVNWMRSNPRVCVEVDSVKNRNDWISVVALGRYEELPDTRSFQNERVRAHELLLQKHSMWWQPGAIAVASNDQSRGFVPIFYRIHIEQLTGHRGVPAPNETGG